ncbi:hypothetical protein VFC49_08295 [Thermococcus sp. SY098]|uniref:hypothetical protein n=1 Tax=Thermococcus sp. SY098 TaxID=3111325 RepID=UPI002D79CC0D|nr:hypothetical protein [Thermococcus sp. SY098]WRS52056.1 hypothetical protein VFC49_08295 [Thermococcus sp. SY098]
MIKVIHNGQTVDETAGTIKITTNKTQGVEIVSFTCTPKEVGLYEWKLDRDRVTCNLVIHNYGDSKIKVAPKVLIDNIETFWVDFREILADSNSSIEFEVKFDDELAKMVYGPSATALNFVQEVQEYEGVKCERNVCYNITKIYYLPKEHTIGIAVYKAENGVPTNQVLARITGETITVKDDNYFVKKGLLLYKEIGKQIVPFILGYVGILRVSENEENKEVLKYIGEKLKDILLEWIGW